MSVIFLLIAISIVVAVCFLGAFVWAVRTGQFEDDYAPSVRILFDEADASDKTNTTSQTQKSAPVNN